jgi:hypothetical protein
MFRTGSCIILLSLLGLPGVVRAADPDGDEPAPKKGVWFPWMNRGGGQSAQGKGAKADKADGAEKRAAALKAQATAQEARELANWLRRVRVCDRLTEIAIINNDAELLRKAQQLSDRAWTMYQERANLPASAAGVMSDQRLLDQRLGTTAGLRANMLPGSAANNTSQASLQGGQP